MYKRIFGFIWLLLFLFSSAFIFIGEKEKPYLKEVSSANMEKRAEILYKLVLENDGEIAILALSGDEVELVRKEETSPLRENDEEILKEGIITDNLEEALMIFEDFIS